MPDTLLRTDNVEPLVTETPAHMNVQPLEEFAVEFVMTLAGLQEQDPEVEPLDPKQLVTAVYAAVSAYARTLPDYDTETDVTQVLQIAVSAYAQAIYASAAELADQIGEEDQDTLDQIEELLGGEQDADTGELGELNG